MSSSSLTRGVAEGGAGAATVKVWDPFVRIYHWVQLGLFILAYATHDSSEALHLFAGYSILALTAARLAWGFVGPFHARFRNFLRGPREVASFLAASARLRAPRHLGHNPAGAAMIVALLIALATICCSGVMLTMDAFWGQKWVDHLHEGAVNVTLVLVALHVGGVFLASFEHRENLVLSMFTGRKRAKSARDDHA
jgi:cytochrome b